MAQLPLIDEHVENMLKHDVIEPATSPWYSNVVMVHKQDGTMRFCVDYCKTNELIKKDKFHLPKIDSCLDALNGSQFFSSCDLCWGYWQTEIARIMELVMSGLIYKVCLVYLDDILVFLRTFEEHCDRLAAIFDRLERYTLKLKPTKCHLFQRSHLSGACSQCSWDRMQSRKGSGNSRMASAH